MLPASKARRSHPPHRSASDKPASRAIRSISDGQAVPHRQRGEPDAAVADPDPLIRDRLPHRVVHRRFPPDRGAVQPCRPNPLPARQTRTGPERTPPRGRCRHGQAAGDVAKAHELIVLAREIEQGVEDQEHVLERALDRDRGKIPDGDRNGLPAQLPRSLATMSGEPVDACDPVPGARQRKGDPPHPNRQLEDAPAAGQLRNDLDRRLGGAGSCSASYSSA